MVTKGEIACFEQIFSFFPHVFKKVCCRGVRKRLYEGKGSHLQTTFKAILAKRENAHDEQFLL